MQIVEALQISGRGLVVVTDVKLSDIAVLGINANIGAKVIFETGDGVRAESAVRSLELFSSPFNPNKPFAFVIEDGLNKTDLPSGTRVLFEAQSA